MAGFSDNHQSKISDSENPASARSPELSATLRLGPGGRVVIPSEMRDAMGLKLGDALLATCDGRALTMVTLAGMVHELQAITSRRVPEGVSLADELIADRRAEAAREDQD